jgi:ribosomal protein S18 acetylase RimI-like enzyme
MLYSPLEMRFKLQAATAEDVPDLVALRNAAAERRTSEYGQGFWSAGVTEKGVLSAMRMGTVYIARYRRCAIATLTLSTRRPWAIDRKYFAASKRPLYLTNMAVAPDAQGKGVGRLCLEGARRIATEWPGDAIRLDAWDAAAGAGEFYRKCGFREVGRATYRTAPLVYFEMIL